MAIDGSGRFWNADGQRRPVAEGFEGERISSAETDRTASAVPNDETPFGRSEASVDDAETESVGDVPRNTGEKGAIVQHQTVASNGRDDGSAGGQRCCQSVARRKSCPPKKKNSQHDAQKNENKKALTKKKRNRLLVNPDSMAPHGGMATTFEVTLRSLGYKGRSRKGCSGYRSSWQCRLTRCHFS